MSKYLMIIILIGVCAPSFAVSPEQNKIIDLVSNERDIDTVYNKIGNAEWTEENLSVITDLWRSDLSKYQGVSRSNIDKDLIKIALAYVLIQATRQCHYKAVSMNELHDYLLSKTKSNNLSIKGRSTYSLGLAGFDSDIPYLVNIIRTEEEGYAEEAALSIMFIHSKAGLSALEKLANSVSRPALKEFISKMVVKYKAYPLIDDSKDCYAPKQ